MTRQRVVSGMSAAPPILCAVASSSPARRHDAAPAAGPPDGAGAPARTPELPNLGAAGAFKGHPPAEPSTWMSRDRLSLVVLLVSLPLAIAAELLLLVLVAMHLI